jgi:hypothetical protein
MTQWNFTDAVRNGIIAGAAGGLAEVVWVALYAAASGGDAASVARGVTTAAGMSALLPATSTVLGIVIHMALALALGVALAFAWRAMSAHRLDRASPYGLTISALAGVWVINFFILLPAISPAFVHLLPHSVSLLSKLLFGLAAAEVLRRCGVERGRVVQAGR